MALLQSRAQWIRVVVMGCGVFDVLAFADSIGELLCGERGWGVLEHDVAWKRAQVQARGGNVPCCELDVIVIGQCFLVYVRVMSCTV